MAAKKTKIWYARPIPMIGTPEDRANLAAIKKAHPAADIRSASLESCKGPKDMQKYFRRVDRTDVVVMAEVSKGVLSSGVFAEGQHGRHAGKKVRVVRGNDLVAVRSLELVKKDRENATKWARVKVY